jgi:hypothetical protein
MDTTRAREIVSAINNRCMVTIGVEEELQPLAGGSLEQMLLAKRMVETANRANQAAAKISGGRYTLNVVPDDRLIATAYVLDHYPCSNEPVLSVPYGQSSQRVVAVLSVPNQPAEAEIGADEC